jgi:hypothetical protein
MNAWILAWSNRFRAEIWNFARFPQAAPAGAGCVLGADGWIYILWPLSPAFIQQMSTRIAESGG